MGDSMDVKTFQLFFSLLALAANAGAIAIVVIRVGAGRSATLARLRDQLAPAAVPLAFVVALTATLGSLYFSEVANYRPCTLCWYQRIAMYPLPVLLAVGMLTRDPHVRRYVWPITAIGGMIAAYHWFVERFPDLETGVCQADLPCSVMWFEKFGFVTLAYMAFSGFAFVAAAMTLRPRTLAS
jgi:disulfide bond formation protein DsbB